MDSKYGVTPAPFGYIDQMNIMYDTDGRDLGHRTKTLIPELKSADDMDGREPCEAYLGPTGQMIGGEFGYPAASFEQ